MSSSSDSFLADFFATEFKGASAALLTRIDLSSFNQEDCHEPLITIRSEASLADIKKCVELCDLTSKFLSSKTSLLPQEKESLRKAFRSLDDIGEITTDTLNAEFARRLEGFSKDVKVSESSGLLNPDSSVQVNQEKKSSFSINKSLFDLFLTEASSQIENIDAMLVAIESDLKDVRKLEALMRACHSLKGAARIVSLLPIVDFMHSMENVFVLAQEAKIQLATEHIDIFLSCVDFLKECKDNNFLNLNQDKIKLITSELSQIENKTFDPKKSQVLKARQNKNFEGANDEDSHKVENSVRVSSTSLNKLMGLAAESMVENSHLEFFRSALVDIKENTLNLIKQVERVVNGLDSLKNAEGPLANLEQARKFAFEILSGVHKQISDFGEYSRRSEMISNSLYSEVIASRMRPFGEGARSFPRMVRDLGKHLGKKITLLIEGRNVPVDRDIIEKLESPIGHILRNACDHGIELPQKRIEVGKSPYGEIKIKAMHSGGYLLLKITDDGAGIDPKLVRQKIKQKGLASDEMLNRMTNEEVFEFLYLPNFTTKDSVSKVSGRGVGLDVVRSSMQEIGGRVKVTSTLGKGTDMELKLPITRSVIQALNVVIDSQDYAFMLNRIYRTLKIPASNILRIDKRNYFELEGKKVWLIDAAQVLGFEPYKNANPNDGLFVVVVADGSNLYGLEVERFISECDLVVRPIDEHLGKVAGISACSISESGEPVLILDVDDMIRTTSKVLQNSSQIMRSIAPIQDSANVGKYKILVADDSLTVRETERLILESEGFDVDVAVDGMDAWNAIRQGNYDLLVTDVDMPRLNGFELTKNIRENDKLKKIPVIAVSYKDRSEDRLMGLSMGVNEYLTKSSFQDETFVKTVRGLLKKIKKQKK